MEEVKAPERIWVDLKSDSEVWTFCEKDAFSQDVCFIRADLHDDLVKAADALAEAVKLSMPEIDDNCVYCNSELQTALTAYRKARGDTE